MGVAGCSRRSPARSSSTSCTSTSSRTGSTGTTSASGSTRTSGSTRSRATRTSAGSARCVPSQPPASFVSLRAKPVAHVRFPIPRFPARSPACYAFIHLAHPSTPVQSACSALLRRCRIRPIPLNRSRSSSRTRAASPSPRSSHRTGRTAQSHASCTRRQASHSSRSSSMRPSASSSSATPRASTRRRVRARSRVRLPPPICCFSVCVLTSELDTPIQTSLASPHRMRHLRSRRSTSRRMSAT